MVKTTLEYSASAALSRRRKGHRKPAQVQALCRCTLASGGAGGRHRLQQAVEAEARVVRVFKMVNLASLATTSRPLPQAVETRRLRPPGMGMPLQPEAGDGPPSSEGYSRFHFERRRAEDVNPRERFSGKSAGTASQSPQRRHKTVNPRGRQSDLVKLVNDIPPAHLRA